MYKIAIIGSGPEHFSNKESVSLSVERVVDLLGFQYGKKDVVFNVISRIGTGLWAAASAKKQGYKYHIYLPYPVEDVGEHWYDDQKKLLRVCINGAYSITSCYSNKNHKDHSYKNLIDNSNFIICFWIGKKQGYTYESIQYALKTNKLILDGLNDLKLITNKDIKRKK